MIRRDPDVVALVVLLAVVFFGEALHRVTLPPVARFGVHVIANPLRAAGVELRESARGLRALRTPRNCR
jgi:hypothetical protein